MQRTPFRVSSNKHRLRGVIMPFYEMENIIVFSEMFCLLFVKKVLNMSRIWTKLIGMHADISGVSTSWY
jgi:hypothetical protein